MPTLTPKQREILDREQRILAVARPMIVREGYHGLNMDRIAEQVGYSKGTIYNHFANKEEIILALALQTVEKRVAMFRRAAEFRGRARHRMVAISVAAERFVRDFPDHFRFEQILSLDSVKEKTSEKRQSLIDGCEMQCMTILGGIVRDAMAHDELTLEEGMSPEDLIFGLWALTSGGYAIMFSSESLGQLGLGEPFGLVRRHCNALMDGYGWKPFSSEFDTDALARQIQAELFPSP